MREALRKYHREFWSDLMIVIGVVGFCTIVLLVAFIELCGC